MGVGRAAGQKASARPFRERAVDANRRRRLLSVNDPIPRYGKTARVVRRTAATIHGLSEPACCRAAALDSAQAILGLIGVVAIWIVSDRFDWALAIFAIGFAATVYLALCRRTLRFNSLIIAKEFIVWDPV